MTTIQTEPLTINNLMNPFKNGFMYHDPTVRVSTMASGLPNSMFGEGGTPSTPIGGGSALSKVASHPIIQIGAGGPMPLRGVLQTANWSQPPSLVSNIGRTAAGGSFSPAFNAPLVPDLGISMQPTNQDFFYI